MNINLILKALSQVGVREIRGKEHNPTILNYFEEIGEKWIKDDETAWCSAFANWVAKEAGAEMSNKLNARSWLNVGVRVEKPKLGNIVVLWRESVNSWKGHVGFFVAERDGYIYILGGNQNNQVRIQAYPKERLLEYRELKAAK